MSNTFRIIFSATILCCASVAAASEPVVINRQGGNITLIPMARNAIRVKVAGPCGTEPYDLIYEGRGEDVDFTVTRTHGNLVASLPEITAKYDAHADALTFTDGNGKIILQEQAFGRTIEPSTVQDESTTIAGQRFLSPADEHIYGLGQFQDGYVDVKGLSRRLTQVNTQIALPMILSNKGYALLWNNYGLTDFNPATDSVALLPAGASGDAVTVDVTSTTGNTREVRKDNTFAAEINVPESGNYSFLLDVGQRMARKHKISVDGKVILDFSNLWLPPTASFIMHLDKGKHNVIAEGEEHDSPTLYWSKTDDETEFRSPVSAGIDYTVFAGNADKAIATYRSLTGAVPMMPLWALGYIHCRERYDTQHELLENAAEFRRRDIPIDVIVQDWQYWGKYGWNALRFDEEKYPDPKLMVDSLHRENIRLMISVWSKLDVNSEVGKKAREMGYLLPGSEWVDFFNPEAARFYWENYSSRLLQPYGIDAWWQDATEPENDDLQGRRLNSGSIPGEVLRNAFPLYVNRTVYQGLRADAPGRRAIILTRSAFPGMQRYATATWSGDVGHDWATLRRQIAGGLGQMAAGLPWWTYDAGGFFRPSDQYENKEYHEIFLRWLQTATFLPLMRVHGYMSDTEPWRYGPETDTISRKYIGLRYRLLPYIYSNAARVSSEGYTLMRPLVMDFPADEEALRQKYQYMFGPSILVSPIVEPGVSQWTTYLPGGTDWYDFRDGRRYSGGKEVTTSESISTIPVFVRAGSILPLGASRQYTSENPDAPTDIIVYPGGDASFTLYEDEGDNYNYEHGAFSTVTFTWDEGSRTLSIGDRRGSYQGMPATRVFNITAIDGDSINIKYDGNPVKMKL